jgi:hypothetical protein
MHEKYDMKTDMKSEMHDLGYRPPLTYVNCDVTLFCGFYPIGKLSETSLNIPAYSHAALYIQRLPKMYCNIRSVF